MAKVVYKYPLKVLGVQTVTLPGMHEILTIQEQNGMPQLWALVDTESTFTSERTILIAGTGYELPVDKYLDYISTFQLHGGSLVFHVFVIRR